MAKVFISGSNNLLNLAGEMIDFGTIKDDIDCVRERGDQIVMGDSPRGVDRQIYEYLRRCQYRHVTIYSITNPPRIAIPQCWGSRVVDVNRDLTGQEKQMAKDYEMANAASCGLAIFNPYSINRYGALQISSGTLRNVIQLVMMHKVVCLFYYISGQVKRVTLSNLIELDNIVKRYANEEVISDGAALRAISGARGVGAGDDLSLVLHSRLELKYKHLVNDVRSQLTKTQQTRLC